MTALSAALGLGFVLAFFAHRDRLKATTPLPPHEELKAKVKELEGRLRTLEAYGGLKHGGPFGG